MTKQVTTTAPKATALDFKVNQQTGEAFISIRKTAELIAVPDTSLRRYLDSPDGAPNFDRKQGLTAEILQKVTHYFCTKGNQKAVELLGKLAEAGAKAFIYHEAGYTVSASPVKHAALPTDYVSALRALADETEQKIMLLEENTERRIITDEGEEYFSAKRIKELNPDTKIGGVKLARSAAKLGIVAKPMFDHYDFANPVTWHVSVWLDAYPQLNYPE